jgi:hypothetical protein
MAFAYSSFPAYSILFICAITMDHWLKVGDFKKKEKTKQNSFTLTTQQMKVEVLQLPNTN